MLGLIPKTIVDLVEAHGGSEKVLELEEVSGVKVRGRYRIDWRYDDDEFMRLLSSVPEVLGIDEEDLPDAFARHFMVIAKDLFPRFFELASSVRDFMLMQPIIHNCMASGLADESDRRAVAQKFAVQEEEDIIVVKYSSPNNLPELYLALLRALMEHYGETGEISQKKLDDKTWEFRIKMDKEIAEVT